MATVTSTTVAIPSFTGLKANANKVSAIAKVSNSTSQLPRLGVRASLKDVGVAVIATAASAVLASNAMAIEVLLGGDDGSLAFVPNSFSVSPGEKIVFKNNAGFPHNVVFDEDEIPSGVDATKISMSEEDLLNGPGETYTVTLDAKGTYKFYCSPHQGAVRASGRVEREPSTLPPTSGKDSNPVVFGDLVHALQAFQTFRLVEAIVYGS